MDTTNSTGTMLDAALELAAQGFAVFPIKERSKEPRTDPAIGFVNGFYGATRDPERISAAWKKYPNDNIAIRCGAPSGNLIVIDVDNHNIKHSGFDTLTDWEFDNGALPATVTAKTGSVIEVKPKSGGLHLFYRTETEIATVHPKDGRSIDVQAAGSYVVAAPSIHPSGHPYEWILPPDIIAVAQADARVMQFVEYMRQICPSEPAERGQATRRVLPSERYRQSYGGTYEVPERVGQGGRNNALYAYGCHLRGSSANYSDSEIADMMWRFNLEQCDPPDDDTAQVKATIREVLKLPPGHSAAWDAAHPGTQRKAPTHPNVAGKLARRLERREKR